MERQCRSPRASASLAAIDCEDSMCAVRLPVYDLLGNTVNVRKTDPRCFGDGLNECFGDGLNKRSRPNEIGSECARVTSIGHP